MFVASRRQSSKLKGRVESSRHSERQKIKQEDAHVSMILSPAILFVRRRASSELRSFSTVRSTSPSFKRLEQRKMKRKRKEKVYELDIVNRLSCFVM